MSKSKSKNESNSFLVSRDKLCPTALSNDDSYCHLPFNHDYSSTYTVVYNKNHLEVKRYDCGCLVYRNQHYPEFKFPELIWIDFFHQTINPGEKLVKFTIQRSNKK